MAREGYLLHAGEDTIHDPEAEKKAERERKTPHGKWENFWYYHKIPVLVAVCVLLVAGYMVWSAVRTVRPDYTVGMVTQQACPEEAADALQDAMAKYGKDLNGDGKVVVQISQYTLSPANGSSGAGTGDAQMDMAYRTKLMADVSAGTSILFLTDDASLRALEQQGQHLFAYRDGSTPKEDASDYDRMRVPLSQCPKLAGLSGTASGAGGTKINLSGATKDLSLSLRIYYGSGIEGKEKDYYLASKALFQKLTS